MELPAFKYHPDPLATGSIATSDRQCLCCGRKTGFIYAGPVYAEGELDQAICPWCIADGTAADKFDAEFVDSAAIGDADVAIESEVLDEISRRTPGFSGWQQERWLACCDDGALYLGPMGISELQKSGTEAIEAVQQESGLEGKDWENYRKALNRDNGPTAYLFRCRHCSRFLAYSDCH